MGAFCYFLGSKAGFAATMFAAVLGIYLLATHTGHVLGALPYLLLLACPLMHLFGHHHGHHHEPAPGTAESERNQPTK
ncbi:DUF2933 domain-containing protein [Bradyrhizobium sp. dw_78]|uniref:DUF2933 domain-containing protein n=1 Tax=Bradyrhizobium sp. dw_78 TaxID=2719793 RepID=UPI001BD5337A